LPGGFLKPLHRSQTNPISRRRELAYSSCDSGVGEPWRRQTICSISHLVLTFGDGCELSVKPIRTERGGADLPAPGCFRLGFLGWPLDYHTPAFSYSVIGSKKRGGGLKKWLQGGGISF